MIPRVRKHIGSAPSPADFFARLVAEGFAGEIDASDASRTVFSTDNSIYQVEPVGILFPKGSEDLGIVAMVLSEPTFSGIAVAPRGGGTGTNGQSLTAGIVIDCSRHMNRIVAIDPVRRVARVEAGVVKDQLNKALKPYGLFFAPELSTSNRATIGGMISTDASGQGSCLYGKTSNHVLGLRIVLTDGSNWWSHPLDDEALAAVTQRADRIGAIYRTVERITREKRERIAEIFPNLNRFMTGYDLAHVRRPDGTFDLNAILCGSEGTLALIAEAELNLVPIPKHAAIINIRYDNFNTALEDARTLAATRAAAVETVDETVLRLARSDIVWNGIARFFPDDDGGATDGINLVEVLADDEADLEQKLLDITAVLDADANRRHRSYTIARGHADVEAIWAMRKRAVGLLGNVEGPARPVAFVEDSAVPPENLAAYIREFRTLLDGAGLSYGMFGHVDAGVLHVRPALDLTRKDHAPLVRGISDSVVALTHKYGGVLWGEHGKGFRSEYVPEFFGDLYPSLQEIKAVFDPENQLNPGKIAAPASAALLKIDQVPLRGGFDRAIGDEIRAAFDNAAYCNGNGACFDFDETSTMCPSYKATRDRRFSPKGRASLMREWLRLMAEKGLDPRRHAERQRRKSPIFSWPIRVFHTLNPNNRQDFSHEVRAAMDTCLACKACGSQCPVKVSVPEFRSKFLELYHGRYLRPLKDPLVGAIESMLPVMARMRPFYNLMALTRGGQALMGLAGLTALPLLPKTSLSREAARLDVPVATRTRIERLSTEERHRAVIFVPDAFTTHFEPKVVVAAIALARKMGLIPMLAPPHVNGKALHVHGYLARFSAAAVRSARLLHDLAQSGVPLVGLDPSMTLAYRSEYRSVPGCGRAPPVLLPQEWLSANLERLSDRATHGIERHVTLMAHCTERSNAPAATALWESIFDRLGARLKFADVGCCGMAGTFGHEVRNRKISEKLYATSWAGPIGDISADSLVTATGYSCRSQIKFIDKRSIPHPIEVIYSLLE